jgi:hypothetical protein
MPNILESMTNLLTHSLEGEPPPPVILQAISGRLAELEAVSIDPSGDGIDSWLRKLREIANDKRLHETLVVRAVQMHFPRLAEALTLLGIIGFEFDADKPAAFSINWQQLNDLLTKPGDSALALLLSKVQKLDDVKALQVLSLMLISAPQALLKLDYAHQGFTSLPLAGDPGVTLGQLVDLINSPLRLPLPFDLPLELDDFIPPPALATPDAEGNIGYVELNGPDNFAQLDQLAIEVGIKVAELLKTHQIDLGNGWQLKFASSESGLKRFQIKFSADHLDAAAPSGGDLGIFLGKQPADANALLIGELNGTHFAIRSVQFGLRLRDNGPINGPLFDIVLKLEHIEFALKPDFLEFLSFGLNLPTVLQFDSDVEVGYVQGKGLTGQGSAGGLPALGMQFATPLNLKIGGNGAGLNVDTVTTRLEVTLKAGGGFDFKVLFHYGANAQFGPLNAVMDGAGVWIGRSADGNGGLLPPDSIGLSLSANPVEGGGFLRIISDNEFAGALQLKILGIGAFAYGLYKTLPSGDPSFVVLIGIRLPLPGIQLSFGFAVSGFGGLVGINRRADTDLLRERLASGSGGDVLFNDNPMANAPKLLGDMQQFFPDERGIFLIGPTLQINWLAIFKLDVGVFIELPGPRKFFIAGSARLVIGSEAFALVYLRMDFIGGIDFTKSLIFFDAALVNSNVLGIFRITGGVALRIAYGENPYFLFTVGGFHPSFNPGAMELPRVARVGASVSLGPVWLKQEMYLAITSNTFQLGSRTEAGLEIGPISAHGWFGFDALIQFKPFYFIAHVDAGFDVEVEGVSLCSVRVEGQLSGPGPLVLEARASVRLLFIKVSGHVTIELNSNPPEGVIPLPDLPEHLKAELSNPDNLRMEGEDHSVIFAAQTSNKDDKLKLLAPVGELVWEQKRVPLNLAIQKAEGIQLGGWHKLVVKSKLAEDGHDVENPEMDWFGVGTFLNLGDSEALNNSRFEQQQSGLRIGAVAMAEGSNKEAEICIELVKLPERFKFAVFFPSAIYASSALNSILGERTSGAQLTAGKAGVKVAQEGWNHHSSDGKAQNAQPLNSVQAFVETKLSGGIALPATEKALSLNGVF